MRRGKSPRRSSCAAASWRAPGWRNISAISSAATSWKESKPRSLSERSAWPPGGLSRGLAEKIPDDDLEVRERQRCDDVGPGKLERSRVPLSHGLTVSDDAPAFDVDDPVFRDAVASVDSQLDALIES